MVGVKKETVARAKTGVVGRGTGASTAHVGLEGHPLRPRRRQGAGDAGNDEPTARAADRQDARRQREHPGSVGLFFCRRQINRQFVLDDRLVRRIGHRSQPRLRQLFERHQFLIRQLVEAALDIASRLHLRPVELGRNLRGDPAAHIDAHALVERVQVLAIGDLDDLVDPRLDDDLARLRVERAKGSRSPKLARRQEVIARGRPI